MKGLQFLQLTNERHEECVLFKELIIEYSKEIDEHLNRKTPVDFLGQWTHGIIRAQGASDRHLELCYDKEKLIGFLYCKIDHPNHRGFIKPGYGCIMEFYVKPEYRLMGYGVEMFKRAERLFKADGTNKMYLTADPVTGVPFWEAMGFTNTGEISPENNLYIFEKSIE